MAPASSRQLSSQFITIAYLSTLAVVLVGIGALGWWLWPASNGSTKANSFSVAEVADAYDSPGGF